MTSRRTGRIALAGALGASLLPVPAAAAPLDVRLRHARHQLAAVVEEYNRIREDLRTTRARLAELTPRLGPMREAVEAQRGKVGALAAGAYRVAASYRVGMILTADDPNLLTDRLVVVTRLADNQQKAVAHLDQANYHYRRAQQSLARLAAEQYKQQAQLDAKRQHVEGEIYRLRLLMRHADGSARVVTGHYRPGAARPEVTVARAAPRRARGPAATAVRFAYAQLGKAYRFGGDGPAGYDCSGLTKAAWAAAGYHLPHNAAGQRGSVASVSRADLRPGDLVFYYADLSHVGLYVGDDQIIHAPTFGERVRVESIGYAPIHSFGRP
ncbi:MAG TPA: NlpC/P60 family protein [Pilimelia sp.]|nr:NlpC/P60 family protein [Pilimelia sp.]